MNFGEDNPATPHQSLRTLTRVTAYMGQFPHVFLGMAFSYADGSKRRFGRVTYAIDGGVQVPAIEQSFELDGPGGERMVAFTSTYNEYEGDALERIEVWAISDISPACRVSNQVILEAIHKQETSSRVPAPLQE